MVDTECSLQLSSAVLFNIVFDVYQPAGLIIGTFEKKPLDPQNFCRGLRTLIFP